MKSTEKTDENYKNLYAAIYKQAVADDCREVRKKAKEALAANGANIHRVREHLDEMEPEIRAMVCEAVCREAQEFGDSSKTKRMRAEAIKEIAGRVVDEFHGR